MGRRNYRRGGRSRYRSYDYGAEAARQHVQDARRLSAELGGADEDVKAYFFGLDEYDRAATFDEYERRYGQSARSYAEATLPRWKSGERRMSGTVAERLFSLLPPRMPLADKYKLTERLWQHCGPSSRKVLRVGADASVADVEQAFLAHIDSVLTEFKLPQQLERRFHWLASGDVGVMQQLLHYRLTQERSLAVAGIRMQLPVMQQHLGSEAGRLTQSLKQTVVIGKHQLEMQIDPKARGVSIEDPRAANAAASGNSGGWGCLLMIAAVLIVLYLFMQQ